MEPTYFRRGEPVAIGSWVIKLSRVETVDPSMLEDAPMLQLGRAPGSQTKVLAIHLEVDVDLDLEGVEVNELEELMLSAGWKFLKLIGAFQLQDADGEVYKYGTPILEPYYQMMLSPYDQLEQMEQLMWQAGDAFPKWVLLYEVPQASRNFSLVVKSSRPREGQPKVAIIALGR